ncbi:MAG: CoB--CoM heterodisulfide reductase iron-sulfur subunit B family protein [Nitrospirota bacterium]
MRVAYYPGCAAQESACEADHSTRLIAPLVGLELVDIPSLSCCGAGSLGEADPDIELAINARNLAIVEEDGLDLLTICSTCYMNISRKNKILTEDQSEAARINEIIGETGHRYKGTVNLIHLLWYLVGEFGIDNLKGMVKRPLKGVKVAPFYGCHILRPIDIHKLDDPKDPSSLERLITALGGEPVPYGGRIRCCGLHIMLPAEEVALKMMGNHLSCAKERGAEIVVTPCTLCQISLDMYQTKAEVVIDEKLNLPVLHLSQLIGLALGLSHEDLMLSGHLVSLETLMGRVI